MQSTDIYRGNVRWHCFPLSSDYCLLMCKICPFLTFVIRISWIFHYKVNLLMSQNKAIFLKCNWGLFHLKSSGGVGLEKTRTFYFFRGPPSHIFPQTPHPFCFLFPVHPPPLRISNGIALRRGSLHLWKRDGLKLYLCCHETCILRKTNDCSLVRVMQHNVMYFLYLT